MKRMNDENADAQNADKMNDENADEQNEDQTF
jgi:hypothetical protein